MKVPLQIYDFIAILFPAVVLVTFVQYEWPDFRWPALSSNYGGLAVALVFTYLLGQFLTAISSILEKNKIFPWLWEPNWSRPREGEMRIRARKSDLCFPIDEGEAILKAIREFYGFEVPPDSSRLFNLVFSPVYDRMAKRETFLAISNLMRNLIIVNIICMVYLIVKTFITSDWVPNLLLVLVFGFGIYVFRNQYLTNLYLSEVLPFFAFLSWYREKVFSKDKEGAEC